MLSIAVFMPNRDELSPPSANPHCAKGLEGTGSISIGSNPCFICTDRVACSTMRRTHVTWISGQSSKQIPASRRSSGLLREYLIEQEIDEHARDGHVHPERPGPTRNPPVLIEPFAQPAHESGQNHRNDHDSQKRIVFGLSNP